MLFEEAPSVGLWSSLLVSMEWEMASCTESVWTSERLDPFEHQCDTFSSFCLLFLMECYRCPAVFMREHSWLSAGLSGKHFSHATHCRVDVESNNRLPLWLFCLALIFKSFSKVKIILPYWGTGPDLYHLPCCHADFVNLCRNLQPQIAKFGLEFVVPRRIWWVLGFLE